MMQHILPAIPIVTPIYAVTAAKWRHLPAIPMLPHAMATFTCYYGLFRVDKFFENCFNLLLLLPHHTIIIILNGSTSVVECSKM